PLATTLYQDEKGGSIFNMQLISFYSTIKKCLNRNPTLSKKLLKKGESPFWELGEKINSNIFYSYDHFNKKMVGVDQYKKNIEILNNRLRKVDEIFETARSEVLNFLQQQTDKDQSKIRKYIEKVKLLEFYNNPFCDLEVGKFHPNAYYYQWIHSIRVCLPLLSLPDFDIKRLILHEIGHAIDPKYEAIPLISMKNIITNESEDAYSKDLIKPSFKRESNLSVDVDKAALKLDKNYPFRKVLTCLKDPKSLGKPDAAFFRSGENFSDWLSIKLISENSLDALDKKDSIYLIPGYFLSVYCTNLSDQIITELERFMKVANCGTLPHNLTVSYGTFLGEQKKVTDPHPSGKGRINKLFFHILKYVRS
ncbi:MAG: hypothetical protein U0T83_00995, partial [Bacteriovoracaceae bacterium]